MNSVDDLKKTLVELYAVWVLADFILLGLSLLYVWLTTGSYVDLLSALFIDWAFLVAFLISEHHKTDFVFSSIRF